MKSGQWDGSKSFQTSLSIPRKMKLFAGKLQNADQQAGKNILLPESPPAKSLSKPIFISRGSWNVAKLAN